MVVLLTLIIHHQKLELTFDNLVFLMNRIEVNDEELGKLEPKDTAATLNSLLVIEEGADNR